MAECPHCYAQKNFFAPRCPNCTGSVRMFHQVAHYVLKLLAWIIILSVLVALLF